MGMLTLALPFYVPKSRDSLRAAFASPSRLPLAGRRLSAPAEPGCAGGQRGLPAAVSDAAVSQELTQHGPERPLLESLPRGGAAEHPPLFPGV